MQELQPKSILEAALLTAQRPLAVRELHDMLGEGMGRDEVRALLSTLSEEWLVRGSLVLGETAAGWRFVTPAAVRAHLEPLHAERPQRYSRAVMETLAVIAYRQPVTRGDIEDIRGVAVGSNIVKQLEDRGWIDCIGHRDAPGRPGLYATTKQFLDDLGLTTIAELPALDGAAAMVSALAQPSLLAADDGAQVLLPLEVDEALVAAPVAPQTHLNDLSEVPLAQDEPPAAALDALAAPSDPLPRGA